MNNIATNQDGNPTYNVLGQHPIIITPSKASRRLALCTDRQKAFVKKTKKGYINQFAYLMCCDEDKLLDCCLDLTPAELKTEHPHLKWVVNAVERKTS